MHTLNKNLLLFALCLSALAGCVDAIGFLQLGGYFISFMSGNSTQLAVSLAQGDAPRIILLATIILCFVGGVILGTMVSIWATPARQKEAVLLLVTLLLGGAALYYDIGKPLVTVLVVTMAMGAENCILRGEGDAMVGVTYMTGNLAKVGQRLAHSLLGGKKLSWLPYLLLWLGLIAGGVTGTVLFHMFGLHSLWVATAWAAILTVVVLCRKKYWSA